MVKTCSINKYQTIIKRKRYNNQNPAETKIMYTMFPIHPSNLFSPKCTKTPYQKRYRGIKIYQPFPKWPPLLLQAVIIPVGVTVVTFVNLAVMVLVCQMYAVLTVNLVFVMGGRVMYAFA